jgi:hypothetical protein
LIVIDFVRFRECSEARRDASHQPAPRSTGVGFRLSVYYNKCAAIGIDQDTPANECHMKCSKHTEAEATAVCVYCGRGICSTCCTATQTGRMVCSAECAAEVESAEQAVAKISQRWTGFNSVAGYLAIAAGLLFGGFGVLEFRREVPHLAAFLLLLSVILIIPGVILVRLDRRRDLSDRDANAE